MLPGRAEQPEWVLHVEAQDGTVLQSVRATQTINPASLVKAATSLWAIERLGTEHRFETRIGYTGHLNRATKSIDGDLIIQSSGDPDFHVENAYLLAQNLNQLGIYEVHGRLLVNSTFWIGWEGGSEKREHNPEQRSAIMASRLHNALDPRRWNKNALLSIQQFEKRRHLPSSHRPRVVIRGTPGSYKENPPSKPLLIHHSNTLATILKRFNSYSNNDIERLGTTLGNAQELANWLSSRWALNQSEISFETLSGLGTNHLSAEQIVRLLNDLDQSCITAGIELGNILPVAGCDPGTIKNYPRLLKIPKGNLVVKTGTLLKTDGGVSVLAGILNSSRGPRTFCVAIPQSGARVAKARVLQEQWVLDLVTKSGRLTPKKCGPKLLFSDANAHFLNLLELD